MAAAGDTTRVRAQARWVRTSARKARLVLEHVRGRSVPEARTILAFTPRAAARDVEKVLRSAVANAEANHGLDGDELLVARAYADEGPTLKRWRARARGRVNRIRKRTCHITIVLEPAPETPRTRRRGRPEPEVAAPPPALEPEAAAEPAPEPEAAAEPAPEPEAAAEPVPEPETEGEPPPAEAAPPAEAEAPSSEEERA
jgi:large subunit ribosomal protein L22